MTNDFIKAIKTRRSIRSFTEEKVDKETITEIIQAGRYAPSADNDQPWKFIVITNKKFINDLALEIKKQLFKWAWKHISRIITRGFPEYYKELLAQKQFEYEEKPE